MDIVCPRCGEPCDMDELHDNYMRLPFKAAKEAFFNPQKGCGFVLDGVPCDKRRTVQGDISAELEMMLGDDVDGIASMMEDFGRYL